MGRANLEGETAADVSALGRRGCGITNGANGVLCGRISEESYGSEMSKDSFHRKVTLLIELIICVTLCASDMPKSRKIPKSEHEVRDPIHIFIHFDSDERRVIDSRPLQRLRHIHQLALTSRGQGI